MNNSTLSYQEPAEEIDLSPVLREKQVELEAIIKAINAIAGTPEWKVLKEKVFDGVVESLERLLNQEAKKKPLNEAEIYSLNGQLQWAKKYADFNKLAQAYKLELDNIAKQL